MGGTSFLSPEVHSTEQTNIESYPSRYNQLQLLLEEANWSLLATGNTNVLNPRVSEKGTVPSLQEVLAIREGAERERRDAKVGGWGTGEDAGFSWEHDIDSWCKLEGVASGVQVGGSGCKLVVESCLLQDEILCASSSAALPEVQGETLAGRFGKSLETVMFSHWVGGDLSLLARELNEGLDNPITWQRASTRLTRVSWWILSLVFSSWSLAKASARGTTRVVASSKRASTRFPKSCRSLWISLTAHCNINSNFLLHKGSSSSSASSWASKTPIICSKPDSAQTLSGMLRASAAAEAGRKSRFTPGLLQAWLKG